MIPSLLNVLTECICILSLWCVCVCVCVLVAQSCPRFNLHFMDKGMGIQRDELLHHSNTASKWASQNSNTGNLSPVLELIISSNVDFLISVWLQDCSNVWEGLCNVYTFFPLFYYLFIYTFILEKGMATTPVFLPGECHGQRSLVGWSLWGHKESDTTERLTLCIYLLVPALNCGM